MNAEEAVDVCTEILEEILPDLPDRAEDFRESVEERISDVRDWIITRNYVTEAQVEMIENTKEACLKWVR